MDTEQPAPAGESADLVTRIRAGDGAAREALLVRHLPALRAYVRLRCGPALRARESASDIVQSACRDVLGDLERFRYGGEAGFKAWLYATALRKIADRAEYWGAQRRDAGREVPLPSGDDGAGLAAALPSPSVVAMGRESMEQLERAFDRLSEDDREIIVLSRVVGLTHTEISEQLGIGLSASRMRLFRALAALSEVLGHDPDAGAGATAPGAR